jgi:hypothetical protein
VDSTVNVVEREQSGARGHFGWKKKMPFHEEWPKSAPFFFSTTLLDLKTHPKPICPRKNILLPVLNES